MNVSMENRPLAELRPKGPVHRALELLSALADTDQPLSIGETAEKLQLAPSTTHRLLNLLKEEGFVTYLPSIRCYTAGPEFFRVASRVSRTVSPVRFAEEAVSRIARIYHQTVLFGLYLPVDKAMSFVARADGDNPLSYRIVMDRPLPLVWGASGKAILARLPAGDVHAILAEAGPSPASGRKRPARKALYAELEAIRERGFGISSGEKLPGACGIAAPVFNASGVLGSLCLTAPAGSLPEGQRESIGHELARHARELSRQLGAD